MNVNIAKIIIVCGVLGISVFVGLLIRISLREPQLKSEQASAPAQLSVEFTKTPSSYDKPNISKELDIPALPISKSNFKNIHKEKSSSSTTMQFFENINKTAKTMEKSLMPNNAPAKNIATITSAEVILSLTEDQFHFLYPDNFIANLIDAQNLFIKEYDPSYEPILKIETDIQVRFIEEKIVSTLLSTGMITKERSEQLITTIRVTLPQLQIIDLKKYNSYNLYESSPFREFLSDTLGLKEPPRQIQKGLFLAGLFDKLASALAHKAQAICGSCESRPLCFQEGAFIPAKPGIEVVLPFCYCTGCFTPLGCLSFCSGQAAIWDPTTGICGCGI